jgi:hypothetical protein
MSDDKDKKPSKLRDLSNQANKDYDKFTDFNKEDGVIDASSVFEAKKKSDKWWKEAIRRFNLLHGLKSNKED